MGARTILTYPNPVLTQRAQGVRSVDKHTRSIMEDLAAQMYASGGIGLAGPQIGVKRRIIAVDTDAAGLEGVVDRSNHNPYGLIVLANPRLEDGHHVVESTEGCLSLPGVLVTVPRYNYVTVSGLDMKGKKMTVNASGLLAFCLQHEIEHLNGVTLIEHIKAGDGRFRQPPAGGFV